MTASSPPSLESVVTRGFEYVTFSKSAATCAPPGVLIENSRARRAHDAPLCVLYGRLAPVHVEFDPTVAAGPYVHPHAREPRLHPHVRPAAESREC